MTSIRWMTKPNLIQFKETWIDGELVVLVQEFTVTACSACSQTPNYPHIKWDEKNRIYLGVGCYECSHKGKIRTMSWVPVTKTKRKCCWNCAELQWHDKESYESTDSSGWFCDKRQGPMTCEQESSFLDQMADTQFKLRSKGCFEPRLPDAIP